VKKSDDDARRWTRRRAYLGEGLTFEIVARDAPLDAEAIDFAPEGLGLAVAHPGGPMPAPGEQISVRYSGRGASALPQAAVVRHVGQMRSGARTLVRLGLSLLSDVSSPSGVERRAVARYPCPDVLPAFAGAACPWLLGERLRFRILAVGAAGMTLAISKADAPPLPRAELDFELHLPFVGVAHGRGRLAAMRRDELGVAWIDPPRELLEALSQYLLAGDTTLTPAALRTGGLPVGSIEPVVSYDCATSTADYEDILALRLHAHWAEGHLVSQSIDDLRSPFDAHSRHITCRFGGRIVGYVRAIFVDGDPARSQYVSLGGHEVPRWLWEAGFVEGGAGAMHPDFQRAGLYVALMQHLFRVAVQSGHAPST